MMQIFALCIGHRRIKKCLDTPGICRHCCFRRFIAIWIRAISCCRAGDRKLATVSGERGCSFWDLNIRSYLESRFTLWGGCCFFFFNTFTTMYGIICRSWSWEFLLNQDTKKLSILSIASNTNLQITSTHRWITYLDKKSGSGQLLFVEN